MSFSEKNVKRLTYFLEVCDNWQKAEAIIFVVILFVYLCLRLKIYKHTSSLVLYSPAYSAGVVLELSQHHHRY